MSSSQEVELVETTDKLPGNEKGQFGQFSNHHNDVEKMIAHATTLARRTWADPDDDVKVSIEAYLATRSGETFVALSKPLTRSVVLSRDEVTQMRLFLEHCEDIMKDRHNHEEMITAWVENDDTSPERAGS